MSNVTFYAIDEEQFGLFQQNPAFRDATILLNDGTKRSDIYDGRRGGLWLTKKGTLRKRIMCSGSVFLPPATISQDGPPEH